MAEELSQEDCLTAADAFVSDNPWGGHHQKIDWCTFENETEADATKQAVLADGSQKRVDPHKSREHL